MSLKSELKQKYLEAKKEEFSRASLNDKNISNSANEFVNTLLLPLFKKLESMLGFGNFFGIRFYTCPVGMNVSLVKNCIPLSEDPRDEEIYLFSSFDYDYSTLKRVTYEYKSILSILEYTANLEGTPTFTFSRIANKESLPNIIPKNINDIFTDELVNKIKKGVSSRVNSSSDLSPSCSFFYFISKSVLPDILSGADYNENEQIKFTIYPNRLCSTLHACLVERSGHVLRSINSCIAGYNRNDLYKAIFPDMETGSMFTVVDESTEDTFYYLCYHDAIDESIIINFMSSKQKEEFDKSVNEFVDSFIVPLIKLSAKRNPSSSFHSVELHFKEGYTMYCVPGIESNEGFGTTNVSMDHAIWALYVAKEKYKMEVESFSSTRGVKFLLDLID